MLKVEIDIVIRFDVEFGRFINMIFISLMILIIAMAMFSENNMRYNRISTLILFYAGALTLNALYIQPIGSGIGIYSGLFQITMISQFFDLFIYSIGATILIA